jgi:hypothetical protein
MARRPSNASSIRTERRHSLPSRVSLGSLASEYSSDLASLLQTPEPGGDFQMRRKRAAKLTQFFGVHYRELINDVLQSLEKGLEREMKRGTLQPGEFDVSFFISRFVAKDADVGFVGSVATSERVEDQA